MNLGDGRAHWLAQWWGYKVWMIYLIHIFIEQTSFWEMAAKGLVCVLFYSYWFLALKKDFGMIFMHMVLQILKINLTNFYSF